MQRSTEIFFQKRCGKGGLERVLCKHCSTKYTWKYVFASFVAQNTTDKWVEKLFSTQCTGFFFVHFRVEKTTGKKSVQVL